jgi:hypothetical protein
MENKEINLELNKIFESEKIPFNVNSEIKFLLIEKSPEGISDLEKRLWLTRKRLMAEYRRLSEVKKPEEKIDTTNIALWEDLKKLL